jgi:hypothetical protein
MPRISGDNITEIGSSTFGSNMASGYSLSVEGYEFIVEDGILYEFLSTAKVL